jgi:hypothetical protein
MWTRLCRGVKSFKFSIVAGAKRNHGGSETTRSKLSQASTDYISICPKNKNGADSVPHLTFRFIFSFMSTSQMSVTLERGYLRSRSWLERRKRRALRVLGCNSLRLLLRILLALEKVHSDMELDAGMHKMARTERARIGNLSDFTRHHGNRPTLCLTSPSSRALFRVSSWSRTSLSFLKALTLEGKFRFSTGLCDCFLVAGDIYD